MYHCHVNFYYVGHHCKVFDIIREMPEQEHFIHDFAISNEPENILAEKADVILADLQDMDAEKVLRTLLLAKRKDTQLILLADKEQVHLLEDSLSEAADIWVMPMSEKEIQFRFLRWQQNYKRDKDHWQTEHYLNAAIYGSPNIFWIKDKSGIYEKVNDNFCKMAGMAREEIEGSRYEQVWAVEEEDPVWIEAECEVMHKKEARVFEETVQTEKGAKQLKTYKSPVYDIDGSVAGTINVGVDVTQKRVYEQEIIKKNQLLEMMFATTDCGILCHSMDGRNILSVNDTALRILGYGSREAMLKAGFHTVAMSVVEEDKPKLRKCINSLKKAGDNVNVEYRVQHKNGKLIYVMGSIKLIEQDGELFYQRFLVDCTDQKLHEEEEWTRKNLEIEYQEKLFDILATYLSNNTDDVYLMIDGEYSQAEYVSDNVERVLGITREEIEEDLRKFGIARYITGKPVTFEDLRSLKPGMGFETRITERINQKTGECKWFCEKVYCVSIQNEKKIVVYISDRTKERKTQTALEEALNMAETANKAKSTFLSSMSHDIRTPMNAIIGLADLLKEEADNPEHVREYTQKISVASQHLLRLINDILDMNKIESGNVTLKISELDVAEIIDDMKTIIQPQAKNKNQIFEISTSSISHECLLGDKLRLEQILINILSNAVKYTQEGGRIKMQVDELPQFNKKYSRIRFTISDNGQGMSQDYQKMIFNPFTREMDTMINQIQGTGLGMAITKKLVDLMGGTIKVESNLGEGSTFTVNLELRIHKKDDNVKFWKDNGIARMIIVDDDEISCQNIVRAMAGTGVSVEFCTDGMTAVQKIQRARECGWRYDIILMDWKMPGLDGLEVARLIQGDSEEKEPVLLFTAYDWSEIEKKALKAGINHFLQKPFLMSNFKNVIQSVMSHEPEQAVGVKETDVIEGKNVLIVDDIAVNRMILEKILSRLHADCDVAVNGKDALEKFENPRGREYDIILMDIQMPVMNGYEATKAIRASAHPSAKEVAILAMTANAFIEDVQKALEVGMDGHVAKPVIVEQLKATISEVLNNKKNRI